MPFTSGPWPHHVLYWLGTGWWCLGLARASLSNLFKSLPAAHVSATTWRFYVCVSWPFMRAFFWFFAPIRSWASYDNGLYISSAHFWFSLLPATLTCNSCRNDSILLDPFLGRPFYSFSQWLITGIVLFFTHGLLCPFGFSLWASTARLLILLGFLSLFANSILPWTLLLTSLGFPGSITLSLSLGFMNFP